MGKRIFLRFSSFQRYSQMSGQNRGRASGWCSGHPGLAHPDMVHSRSTAVNSTPQIAVMDSNQGPSVPSLGQQSSQHGRKAKTDGMSFVRKHYRDQGFSENVIAVLLDSWRPTTQKQYAVYIKKWNLFCRESEISPHFPDLTQVLEFLYTQLHLSYSTMNTAQSALSCIIFVDNMPVGQHPLVCRFLKGVFERKPASKKYYGIWDVKTVLQFLRTFITLKLAMLLALVGIQRKQTLLHLNVNSQYMVKSHDAFVFTLSKHVKQSRPNYSVPPVIIPRYTVDPEICPYVCLEEYIDRTRSLHHDEVLLISMIKPPRAVTAQTLARWIKTATMVRHRHCLSLVPLDMLPQQLLLTPPFRSMTFLRKQVGVMLIHFEDSITNMYCS